VTGGRAPPFRDLSVRETAALRPSKGMRSPASAKRDADKSQKRPAREPRNERKGVVIRVCLFQKAKFLPNFEISEWISSRKGLGRAVLAKIRDLMTEQATEEDWTYCREMLPKVSRTFALNIGQLEGNTFRAVLLGYLLFRIADTFEDNLYQDEREKIADLRNFSDVFRGDKDLPRRMELYEPLKFKWKENSHEKDLIENGWTILRCYFDIPEIYRSIMDPLLVEASEGMAEFQRRKLLRGCAVFQLADAQELEDYCYYVAGVVGVMLTKIFCLHERAKKKKTELEAYQIQFGLGLQLINIVKDFQKDIGRGWCYIPSTLTQSCNIDLDKMDALSPDQRRKVIQAIIPRVVEYLDSTLKYIQALPMGERSIRKFCIIPFVIAYRTLVKIVEMGETKVSRKEIASIMNEANAFAKSNRVLEDDYLKTRGRFLGTAANRPD
jgi:farnesyl-diphosphate farnesyltransferase